MNIDTRKSLRWTLTIFPRTQPTRVLDTRVSTGTFVEVLNGVMLLAADMEDNAVRMVIEGDTSGEGFEVFRNVFVQFREVAPTLPATEGRYWNPARKGETIDAAGFGREWYGEGGDRDRLAEELTQAQVASGGYAPRADELDALDAYDACYSRDARAQRPEGERDMTEEEFLAAQSELID